MSVMSPLTDSYSGRMTEQSLTVQRSCRFERGSAPESVAIRGRPTSCKGIRKNTNTRFSRVVCLLNVCIVGRP